MTFRWTDTLKEPLASAARGREWNRVEEAREGGWLLLAQEGEGDGVAWYRLRKHEREVLPISSFEDRRLPRLSEVVSRWFRLGLAVELLAWRVGSRAIFQLRGAGGPCIAKLYRKDRQILDRWTHLPSDPRGPWRVPRILDWDPERILLSVEFCPGVSLNRRWLAGEGEAGDGERVASLLEWLAAHPPPAGFPEHRIKDEARVLEERLAVFERTLVDAQGKARELTGRVLAALAEVSSEAPLLCHRDFHDKQVLLDGEKGCLIDLDLAAAGPPALDVGNIIAHLRLRALKGARLPWREIAAGVVERAVPARGIEASLSAWTASTLLRLGLIYARRRRTKDLIDNLLASTEEALERRGEWKGIL
ncbi:MAG: aminoglycoside phosphotransferase family protein [Planctomycetota bacterium]